jgi:putative SbcD/Mre11-related phosphoesterase
MSRGRREPLAVTYACGAWQFTPEGAAIHPGERTAVVADVHLGYEWARGAAGDCVPSHSLEETVARLSAVLARAAIARLVVAGDLVESARPCHRTDDDVRRLGDWLESRGVTLLALEGNHDRGRRAGARASAAGAASTSATGAASLPAICTVDGWTIAHGHRPIAGERTITGHYHPVLRAGGRAAPCFLAGPGRIVLPAFSANAAGCDVLCGPVPREWTDEALHCIASTGSDLLDFGPLPALRRVRDSSP